MKGAGGAGGRAATSVKMAGIVEGGVYRVEEIH